MLNQRQITKVDLTLAACVREIREQASDHRVAALRAAAVGDQQTADLKFAVATALDDIAAVLAARKIINRDPVAMTG